MPILFELRKLFTSDFIGHVDSAANDRIRGWACDRRHLRRRVEVELLIDGTIIARTLADHYREDLQRAGLGDGRHGFAFHLPSAGLDRGAVSVRVKGSSRPLIDDTPEWLRHRSSFCNSIAQGFPVLDVAATKAEVKPADEAVAAEMLDIWQRLGRVVSASGATESRNMWSALVQSHHAELVSLLSAKDPRKGPTVPGLPFSHTLVLISCLAFGSSSRIGLGTRHPRRIILQASGSQAGMLQPGTPPPRMRNNQRLAAHVAIGAWVAGLELPEVPCLRTINGARAGNPTQFILGLLVAAW